MSIYDTNHIDLSWSDNTALIPLVDENITNKILRIIEEYQWAWPCFIIGLGKEIEKKDIYKEWQKTDPICKTYAHYNVLNDFLIAYTIKHLLPVKISLPCRRICKHCNKSFSEDDNPPPVIRRFGINRNYLCKNCVEKLVYKQTGMDNLSKHEITEYIARLTELIGRVPTSDFGVGVDDFKFLNDEKVLKLIDLLRLKPSMFCIEKNFDSWLHVLIEANVLEGNVRKTARGIQCLAKDDHVCLSLGEKTIDDFLFEHNIEHNKEPKYPEGQYRGDFIINDVIVEYFGLAGNKEYDEKIMLKRNICKKHKIKLIEIYPYDLIKQNGLEKKFKAFIKTAI